MTKPDNLPVPAEQTEAQIERDRAKAYKIGTRIKAALQKGRKASWELAEGLYSFREARGWLALGYETLGEWLAEPEIGLSWATFDRMVRVYDEFAVKRGLDSSALTNLDPSKADIVRPALKRGDVLFEDAIGDVTTLGWRDLREKYVRPPDETGQPPSDPEPQGPADEPSDVLEEPHTDVRGEPVTGEVLGSKASDLSAADAGELDDALGDWHLLQTELREGASSGVEFPRISGVGIEPGLDALQRLVRASIDSDIIFED